MEKQISNAVVIKELMIELEFHRNRKMILGDQCEKYRAELETLKAKEEPKAE